MCMYNTDKILWLHLYLFRLIIVSRWEKTGEPMCFVTELFWNLTNLVISVLFSFCFFLFIFSGKPKSLCRHSWAENSGYKSVTDVVVRYLSVTNFMFYQALCSMSVVFFCKGDEEKLKTMLLSSFRKSSTDWQKPFQLCRSRYEEKMIWTLTPRACCMAHLYSSLSGRRTEGR